MEFEIEGKKYRAGKLNAFQQQDLAVALVPVIPALKPIWDSLKINVVGEDGKPAFMQEAIVDFLVPLADAIRSLGKENRYEINDICLSVVSRESGGVWSNIYINQQLMFDDINGLDLLKIVGHVVKGALGNFFPALPESDEPDPLNPV
ncbi:bacteriophage protein [Xenorhabdus mauleonii]|uniref:Bacteriophage protein n=1 Tax=Xenorhabdus mauleonii TaxID=351675 RepID=A0A1I3WP22_9GAMM|nr:hypothetical protein [Xenorhabdus mauleonii]PHM39268.1 bacteriophage protein [Xenorhabdus mauleonii]SFK09245.1 hypothetical protein SAMN05421680_12841 [Xenorhabdus mauleonii]